MSEQQQISPAASDPKVQALVKTGIGEVMKGKISLSDLIESVMTPEPPVVADKKPPVPAPLSEAQIDALKRLPEVYGRTTVKTDRKLTEAELVALVEERDLIDLVLAAIDKRKSESIREALANHLDHLVPEDERDSARKDKRGHLAVKQEVPVPGTGRKVQRIVSGGKPNLTIQHVEELHAEGAIDRKTYLAITRKPDLPRVLDEDGLHKAIQKDPRLFFLLGSKAEPTTPTTTIKVANDS